MAQIKKKEGTNMAINFEPIFSEMQNGPEKIKENFDKINDGKQWGPTQNATPGPETTGAFTYRIRNDDQFVVITFWPTGIKTHPERVVYLPTSITSRMLTFDFIGRADNGGYGTMRVDGDTGKCTFTANDDGGIYIQQTVALK